MIIKRELYSGIEISITLTEGELLEAYSLVEKENFMSDLDTFLDDNPLAAAIGTEEIDCALRHVPSFREAAWNYYNEKYDSDRTYWENVEAGLVAASDDAHDGSDVKSDYILPAAFVSVWDDDITVTTSCKVNILTHQIFAIEVSCGEPPTGSLTGEYVVIQESRYSAVNVENEDYDGNGFWYDPDYTDIAQDSSQF